jgi:hypothetical protein
MPPLTFRAASINMFVFKPTVCATLPAEKDAKQSRRRLFAVTPIAQNYLILLF